MATNRVYEFNNPVGGDLSLSNTLVGTSPSRRIAKSYKENCI